MTSSDYQVQNIFRYNRKSFKSNKNTCLDSCLESDRDQIIDVTDNSPRHFVGGEHSPLEPTCSCTDPDGDVATILHKKCPVITLAQKQLLKLLDEADMLICENTRTCRSLKEFLIICKDVLVNRRQSNTIVLFMLLISLFMGILLGAGSCGTYAGGQFNSPILSCIDSYFIQDTFATIEESYRSIA